MLPRSSMVTSRLTRTRLRASAREPLDRLTETIAGSSCGVMPIAIARLKSSASISGRSRATLIAKIATVRTPATLTSRAEKPRSPTWKAVSAGRSPSPSAIFPNAVAVPVATTTPCARALVDDGAHERARRQVDGGVRRCDRRRRLRRGERLAGEDRLVALEPVDLDEPHVGRHHVAHAQRDDVARHEGRRRRPSSPRRRAGPAPRSGCRRAAPRPRAPSGTR